MLIPSLDLDFLNSDTEISFGANLSPKIQSCPFCLEFGVHSISRILIGNPDSKFSNSNPKSIFEQI